MRDEVLRHKNTVNKYLGRYGQMSRFEAEELEGAYEEIRRIQDRCFHEFQSGPLFTSDEWVCDYCGISRDKVTTEEVA